jgi:hypothetical protein
LGSLAIYWRTCKDACTLIIIKCEGKAVMRMGTSYTEGNHESARLDKGSGASSRGIGGNRSGEGWLALRRRINGLRGEWVNRGELRETCWV